MLTFECKLIVEDDTGLVEFVFRWKCCSCSALSCWLVDDTAAFELAESHIAIHLA